MEGEAQVGRPDLCGPPIDISHCRRRSSPIAGSRAKIISSLTFYAAEAPALRAVAELVRAYDKGSSGEIDAPVQRAVETTQAAILRGTARPAITAPLCASIDDCALQPRIAEVPGVARKPRTSRVLDQLQLGARRSGGCFADGLERNCLRARRAETYRQGGAQNDALHEVHRMLLLAFAFFMPASWRMPPASSLCRF